MALKFPNDLPEKYYTSIGFSKYERPDPFKSLVQLYSVPDVEGRINIPIPQNVVDSQALKWTERTVAFPEVVGDVYDGLVNSGDWNNEVKNSLLAAGVDAPGQIARFVGLGQGAAGEAADVAKALLQRAGLAINPVLSMMFDHPEYKRHSFSWKFSPDSSQESQTLSQIIETLRFHSLPDITEGGLFFQYPSIVQIQMHTGDRELYRFQPCVINSIEVNYAANQAQVPSFFGTTAAPTSVSIKIDLVEIILNTRKNTADNSMQSFSLGPSSNAFNPVKELLKNPSGLIKGLK